MSQERFAEEIKLSMPESASLWVLNLFIENPIFNDTWHAYNFMRLDIGDSLLTIGGKFSPETTALGWSRHLHELKITAPKGQEDNLRKILQKNGIKDLRRTYTRENVEILVYQCNSKFPLDLANFFNRR